MNSRERIVAAIEHKAPDRIPVDFGGHRSSGIMAIGYNRLRDYLGLPKRPAKVYDFIQQLAIIDDDVYARFPTDVVDMSRAFCLEDKGWKEWPLPNGETCLIPEYVDVRKEGGDWFIYNAQGRKCGVMRAGSLYFDQIYWPYEEEIPEDLSDLPTQFASQMWGAVPTPPKNLPADQVVAKVADYRKKYSHAINFAFGGNLYEPTTFLCTIPNAMMWMLLEPERYAAVLDKLVEGHMKNINGLIRDLAPYLDVILFGDDFGMGTGTQFSEELFVKYFKPRQAKMWAQVKKVAPNLKIQLHSCGGIFPFIRHLAEAGLHAFNPVQTNCTGMDPHDLKNKVGDIMTFWGGGCDTTTILPRATPAEIRQHVIDRCRIFSPRGGFIFQQVHNIMSDVPPENIAAMFDAVKEYNEKYYEQK